MNIDKSKFSAAINAGNEGLVLLLADWLLEDIRRGIATTDYFGTFANYFIEKHCVSFLLNEGLSDADFERCKKALDEGNIATWGPGVSSEEGAAREKAREEVEAELFKKGQALFTVSELSAFFEYAQKVRAHVAMNDDE